MIDSRRFAAVTADPAPMRVLVDALAARGGDSYTVVLENLLAGWVELATGDQIHLAVTEQIALRLPDEVTMHVLPVRRPQVLRRVLVQSTRLPRLCREIGADVLLTTLPASSMRSTGCPRTAMVWDLRHELRPEQFSRQQRLLRRVSYGWGYRRAASLVCASQRTRTDLLTTRPWLAATPITVALLGADHVHGWARSVAATEPYALAFGQYGNKNVEQVLHGWAVLAERGTALPLVLVGTPDADRRRLQARVDELHLTGLVEVLGWLPTKQFQARFAAAAVVVFPSDFEGFGLPAPEAMRLSIPVVVSTDLALREICGGHATVVPDRSATALAEAVTAARALSPQAREQARQWAGRYTWTDTARRVREALAQAVSDRR